MIFAPIFAGIAMLFAVAQSASITLNPVELDVFNGQNKLSEIIKRQADDDCLAKIPLKARLELCVFGCDHCLDECTCDRR